MQRKLAVARRELELTLNPGPVQIPSHSNNSSLKDLLSKFSDEGAEFQR